MSDELFNEGFIDGGVRIQDKVFESEQIVSLDDFLSKEENTHIKFIRCTFKKKLTIDVFNDPINKTKQISFHNCQINDSIEIVQCNNIKVRFLGKPKSEKFYNKIDIYTCAEKCDFDFNSVICHNLEFTSNFKRQNINIFNCDINYLSFNGVVDSFFIISGDRTKIDKLKMSSIELGKFKFSNGRISEFEAYDCFLDWFIIKSNSKAISIDEFDLNQCKIDTFTLDNIEIDGSFSLKLIQIESEGFITNSIFNQEAYFENIDFNGLKLINLDFSKLMELSFSGSTLNGGVFQAIKWPSKFSYNYEITSKSKTQLFLNWLIFISLTTPKTFDIVRKENSLSEQYRQLKVISQNNGDKFSSLQFYRNEMNSKSISAVHDKSISIYDIILLKTNMWFSEFGLNYIKPLKWLFSVHIVIFTLFVLSGYNNLEFVWPWFNTTEGLGNSFGQFFYLLNPLHKLPEVENSWILVLDFFSRIINSYFIYYFLKATRKFTFN